jgi:hypothetical protein
MKAFLLAATILISSAGSVFAQNFAPDYEWEAGINIGASAFTRPLGPTSLYTGTSTKTVPDYSVRVNHFINEHWLIGIDIGSRKWQSFGTWQENGTTGQTLNNQQVSFLIASHAINESFEINYLLPFYARFRSYTKSNVYFGAMVGFVTTVNDGSIGYGKYKGAIDSGSTYVSSYDYGFGIGYNFGLQVGYAYYILPQLSISIELAARYADVHTNNVSYGNENQNFNLLYFPETIGVRYRF